MFVFRIISFRVIVSVFSYRYFLVGKHHCTSRWCICIVRCVLQASRVVSIRILLLIIWIMHQKGIVGELSHKIITDQSTVIYTCTCKPYKVFNCNDAYSHLYINKVFNCSILKIITDICWPNLCPSDEDLHLIGENVRIFAIIPAYSCVELQIWNKH